MSELKNEYPLVIVGAGAAGLGASQSASEKGIEHVVLEASHRIGGRGLTEYLEGNIPVDLGCHWLHSADINPYREWADKLGFSYSSDEYKYDIHYEGEWLGPDSVRECDAYYEDSYRNVHQLYSRNPGIAMVEAADADSKWAPFWYYWATLMHSNDADQVAVQDQVEFHDTGKDWPVRKGYGALIAKQGENCPVQVNTEVQAIDYSRSPVIIKTNRGTIRAEHVIIAVSTGVLGADCISFTPDLPEAKLDSIHSLPMGNYNYQIFSIEPDALSEAPENIHYFDGEQSLAIRIGHHGYPHIFTCVAGRYAWWLEKQGTEASRQMLTEALASIFGGDVTSMLREFKVSAWGYDPWIRGAYSSQVPGKTGMRQILAEPVNECLYFAGEATSTDVLNTAHGAYLSGKRAVSEVSDSMGVKAA